MNWESFYLVCFLTGFAFSLISVLLGGKHVHLPHFFHGHSGLPHSAGGHASAGGGRITSPAARGTKANVSGNHVSPLNFMTFTAFMAWFGGTGYLLTRYSTLWIVMGLSLAVVSGLTGAGIVFLFMHKVLTSPEETLDPADYEMVGVLGRITVPIREGGTGEIIYSQAGTRRTCGVRAEQGHAIANGSEVVVTSYEKGIAYVRLWDEMAGDDSN